MTDDFPYDRHLYIHELVSAQKQQDHARRLSQEGRWVRVHYHVKDKSCNELCYDIEPEKGTA